MRRKQGKRTVRGGAARAVEATAGVKGAGYPTADALVQSGEAWREWLDEALRRVLGPAAIAGAIGVAAVGCGTSGGSLAPFGATQVGGPAPVATAPTPLSPFAPTMPSGSADKPTAGQIAFAPLGPPVAPVVPVVLTQPITPRPQPRPPVQPTPHPIAMGGAVRPPTIVRPPNVVRPPANPPMMRGGPPPMRVVVPPPPPPAPPPTVPLQQQPDPPSIEGGLAMVQIP